MPKMLAIGGKTGAAAGAHQAAAPRPSAAPNALARSVRPVGLRQDERGG